MTGTISQGMKHLEVVLNRHGINASIDPPTVPVPGVWLSASRIDTVTLCGQRDLWVDCFLIAPDNGVPAALDELAALFDKFITAADTAGLEVTNTNLGQMVTLPNTGPLPAFLITIKIGVVQP